LKLTGNRFDSALRTLGASAVAATLSLVAAAQTPTPSPAPDPAPLPADNTVEVLDDRVELHVADVPLATVLRMLSVQGERNIIATPAVTGTVTADLYDASFDDALRAVLSTNNADFIARDGFIYVYTNEEIADIIAAQTPVTARMYTLDYISAADVETVIEPLLSDNGKITRSPDVVSGLDSATTDETASRLAGTEFLVVYDYPDNLDKIAEVIDQIDVRPLQVLVEATILRARLTDNNSLGVDFTLLAGVDLELLDARSTAIQNVTLGELPTARLERFNANATTAFAKNVPDGGLTLGILKDQVGVFVRALEEVTDSSVLANPKLLTLNKQIGNVIVGRRDGYITTTVTQTTAVQKVEFLETGTQLTFRPYIGTDGYIRMELRPKDSVGGLTAAQLPFEQTTEITTDVIIRDGYTILIGGLFREVTSESRSQIPLLGDIPRLGNLFRSRTDALDREEVIILLTVHIVNNDDLYAENSMKTLQNIERARVGLRRGMMWHGRERLGQSYFRAATLNYNAGNTNKALWNVQMALHNYPRLLPAIQLLEHIEQTRDWDEDATITRDFIFNLIRQNGQDDGALFERRRPNSPPPTPDEDASPQPEAFLGPPQR